MLRTIQRTTEMWIGGTAALIYKDIAAESTVVVGRSGSRTLWRRTGDRLAAKIDHLTTKIPNGGPFFVSAPLSGLKIWKPKETTTGVHQKLSLKCRFVQRCARSLRFCGHWIGQQCFENANAQFVHL